MERLDQSRQIPQGCLEQQVRSGLWPAISRSAMLRIHGDRDSLLAALTAHWADQQLQITQPLRPAVALSRCPLPPPSSTWRSQAQWWASSGLQCSTSAQAGMDLLIGTLPADWEPGPACCSRQRSACRKGSTRQEPSNRARGFMGGNQAFPLLPAVTHARFARLSAKRVTETGRRAARAGRDPKTMQ